MDPLLRRTLTFPFTILLLFCDPLINPLHKTHKKSKPPQMDDCSDSPLVLHRDQSDLHFLIDTRYGSFSAPNELIYPPDTTQLVRAPFDTTSPYFSQSGSLSLLLQDGISGHAINAFLDTLSTGPSSPASSGIISTHSELRHALTPVPSPASSGIIRTRSELQRALTPTLSSPASNDIEMSDGATQARSLDFYKKAAGEHRDYAIIKSALRTFYHDEMNGEDLFQSFNSSTVRTYLLAAEKDFCNREGKTRGLTLYDTNNADVDDHMLEIFRTQIQGMHTRQKTKIVAMIDGMSTPSYNIRFENGTARIPRDIQPLIDKLRKEYTFAHRIDTDGGVHLFEHPAFEKALHVLIITYADCLDPWDERLANLPMQLYTRAMTTFINGFDGFANGVKKTGPKLTNVDYTTPYKNALKYVRNQFSAHPELHQHNRELLQKFVPGAKQRRDFPISTITRRIQKTAVSTGRMAGLLGLSDRKSRKRRYSF